MDLRTKLEGLLGRVRGLHPLLRPASILWALVFVVLALTLWGLASAGTLVIDGDSFALIELILVMGAALSLSREYLLRPLDRLADSEDVRKKLLGRAIPVVRDVAILAALVATTTLTLELPWNTSFSEVDPSFIGLDRLVVTIVVVCAYFVGQRRGAVLALAVSALDTLGIAQGFMLALKGTALLPSDLARARHGRGRGRQLRLRGHAADRPGHRGARGVSRRLHAHAALRQVPRAPVAALCRDGACGGRVRPLRRQRLQHL